MRIEPTTCQLRVQHSTRPPLRNDDNYEIQEIWPMHVRESCLLVLSSMTPTSFVHSSVSASRSSSRHTQRSLSAYITAMLTADYLELVTSAKTHQVGLSVNLSVWTITTKAISRFHWYLVLWLELPIRRTVQLLVVIRSRLRIPDHISTSLTIAE